MQIHWSKQFAPYEICRNCFWSKTWDFIPEVQKGWKWWWYGDNDGDGDGEDDDDDEEAVVGRGTIIGGCCIHYISVCLTAIIMIIMFEILAIISLSIIIFCRNTHYHHPPPPMKYIWQRCVNNKFLGDAKKLFLILFDTSVKIILFSAKLILPLRQNCEKEQNQPFVTLLSLDVKPLFRRRADFE